MTQEEFNFVIENGKRLDEIRGFKIQVIELPYLMVKERLPALIQSLEIKKSVNMVMDYFDINPKGVTFKEMTAIYLFLYDELLTNNRGSITWMEGEYLAGEPDVKLIAAGSRDLAPFNTMLTLQNLCGGNYLQALELGEKPYRIIFDAQLMNLSADRVKERYSEILKNTQKG